MAVSDELRRAVDEIAAVDQHAHLLAGPGAGFGIADLVTESRDPAQIAKMRDHAAFKRAVRDLGTFLETDPDEEAIEAARAGAGPDAWSQRLMAGCHFDAMLVDDGFRFPGALTMQEHAAAAECRVRRILRIESVAESVCSGAPRFDEVRERFRAAIAEGRDEGAVALKTIAAYRCGLDLAVVDEHEAGVAYRRLAREDPIRLEDRTLISFFISEALDVVGDDPVPLQVHTGIGDADLHLSRADPSLLRAVLGEGRWPRVPVVLLHCYPFIGQASYLASIYSNVYLDLSLGLMFVAHRGHELVLQALDLAPASKLLFATDASRLPEMFFLAALWWRDALARALGSVVDTGLIDRPTALSWAGRILAGNGRELYGV